MMKRWKILAACLAIGMATATWNAAPARAEDPAKAQMQQARRAQDAQIKAQREAARQQERNHSDARVEARRGALPAPGNPGCFHGVGLFGGGC